MKIKFLKTIFLLGLVTSSLTSCVGDDDYVIPTVNEYAFKEGFESFRIFLEKYKEQKPILVVWNKLYIDFLVNYCKQNNLLLENYVNKSTIDLLSLFTFFLKGNELECYTLESICDYFNIPFHLELIHKVKILYTLYCKL